MEILRISRTQEVENEQNCSALIFSASSVVDYSIEQPSENWFTSAITDTALTLNVSDNEDNRIGTNPPTWTDRGAGITLIQAESGNKINIGLFQSGKAYTESYRLVESTEGHPNPAYQSSVRASDTYVLVTWTEAKFWTKDDDPTSSGEMPGTRRTYERQAKLELGPNTNSAATQTNSFSFVSDNGVTVSGTVTQAKNTCVSSVNNFANSHCTPSKIFWGEKDAVFAEDASIFENSSSKSSLSLSFNLVTGYTWEVRNYAYPTEKTGNTTYQGTYNRPKDDDADGDDVTYGFDFLDTVDDVLYDGSKKLAHTVYNDVYVSCPYYYYTEIIQRDFYIKVFFREEDGDNNIIATDDNFSFQVSAYTSTVCEESYTGNSFPNPLKYYQQESRTNVTGELEVITRPNILTLPDDNVLYDLHAWKRRYFYSYPDANNVELENNATVYSGSMSSTTANTNVANLYARIEYEEDPNYDYTLSVEDNDGNQISRGASGYTTERRGIIVIDDQNSYEWYPAQKGREGDSKYARYINFIITRRPRTP